MALHPILLQGRTKGRGRDPAAAFQGSGTGASGAASGCVIGTAGEVGDSDHSCHRSAGGGTDYVTGDWSDRLSLREAAGAPPPSGWTYLLASGSVAEAGAGYLVLSADAVGTLTLADGGEIAFQGIERIEW